MGVVIDAHLVVRRAAFTLDVELTVAEDEVVALLGPNGAGKTTALRALAGLLPLSSGHIRFGGEEWGGLPADRRPVGMVFQDYLLFPHLTALDNVAFGPRCHGVRKGEARRLAAEWLDRVGLASMAGRRPRTLSGGQAQRVALARALAVRPRLLLLDEPLAALDVDTRREIRAGLRRHLAAFEGASLLVTHDPLDAMALADRLIVIEEGQVVQEGAPAHVARHPRTDYVARLVGLNLYRGLADGHDVTLDGLTLSAAESLRGEVFLVFRPSAVALFRTRPDGSPRNLWKTTIGGIEPHGDQVRIHLDGPMPAAADITPAALAELGLADGDVVWAAVKATETHAYPA
ncbi:MAG: ABC transporter ATP-binding protein [Actinoallomurus sp.]